MKLHERLKELRSERGLRLRDVAALTGYTFPYIGNLECGRYAPGFVALTKLAAAYGITLSDVLAGVKFEGEGKLGGLPRGLADLRADPYFGSDVTPDWIQALARIEHNGKRPRTKGEYYEIFTHLRRILAPEEATK